MPNKAYLLLIALLAGFSGILFGYDTGIISGAILFIEHDFPLTSQLKSFVIASVLIGALFGALASGKLADHYGRKKLLIFDSLLFIGATLLATFATTINSLIFSRLIIGIAIGIASYTTPLYLSEVSPAKERGFLVSLNQLANVFGMLLSYFIAFLFAEPGGWRPMFAIGTLPAIVLLIGMLFLPHTPRWLLSKGRKKEALHALTKLRNSKEEAKKEIAKIATIAQQSSSSWKKLFQWPIRNVLMMGIGLAFMQQVTGINAILYYAPTIFHEAGFGDESTSILATVGIGLVFLIATIIILPLIDKVGRKPLLYIGLSIMTSAMTTLSILFSYKELSEATHWAILSSMLIYIIGFAISLGPIMWLMIAEIFPLKIRGIGSSLATGGNWLSNFFVTLSFLPLVETFGNSFAFWVYAMMGGLSLLFVYYFIPETKGCPLEVIESNLLAGHPLRNIGKKE